MSKIPCKCVYRDRTKTKHTHWPEDSRCWRDSNQRSDHDGNLHWDAHDHRCMDLDHHNLSTLKHNLRCSDRTSQRSEDQERVDKTCLRSHTHPRLDRKSRSNTDFAVDCKQRGLKHTFLLHNDYWCHTLLQRLGNSSVCECIRRSTNKSR